MPFRTFPDLDACRDWLRCESAALLWFSGPDCNVCHALRPKVGTLMEEEFPRIALGMMDIGQQPRVKGAFQVFSIPTLLVYFEDREMLRLSRGFSLTQLRAGLERPYRLFFE